MDGVRYQALDCTKGTEPFAIELKVTLILGNQVQGRPWLTVWWKESHSLQPRRGAS